MSLAKCGRFRFRLPCLEWPGGVCAACSACPIRASVTGRLRLRGLDIHEVLCSVVIVTRVMNHDCPEPGAIANLYYISCLAGIDNIGNIR